jgi:aerobic-type carbon monoxide dehydrogenase small subunit (CoxS/CutS family)
MPAFMLRDRRVETIENFTKTREYSLLYSELTKEGRTLCSSCHNGILLVGMALLRSAPAPTRDEIFDCLSNVHCDSIDPEDFADAVLKTIQHLPIARKMP